LFYYIFHRRIFFYVKYSNLNAIQRPL